MQRKYVGIGTSLGLCFGVVLGAALRNVGLGLALGLTFGAAIGAALAGKKSND